MRVLATGISSVGKKNYFKQVKELGRLNNVDIAVYDAGRMLFEVMDKYKIKVNPEKVLNMPDNLLKALMGNVYEKISNDIHNHEHAIISTHAMFLWKHIWRDSGNALFLDKVEPDLYVTVIDPPCQILERLKKNKQWGNENLSLLDVINWQDLELMVTSKYWAGITGMRSQRQKPAPYLALPKEQPPESLLKIMLFPDIKLVYCAFPMTNLQEEDSNQKINEFIRAGGGPLLGTDVGLRDFYVVIDPRTYELEMGATEAENAHTVHRDLEYFVGYTDATICYFPEIVYSSGAINEMKEAHSLSREVNLIMDKEERSPFVDFNVSKFFREPKAFFESLKEKVRELKRPEGYQL